MIQERPMRSEVADDLRRTFAREELRRKRLTRTLTGVGVFVLLVAVLLVAGLVIRGTRPSAASASLRPAAQPTALVAQPRDARARVAAKSSAPAANPTKTTKAVAPKKTTASKKAAPAKTAPSRRVAVSPAPTPVGQSFKIAIGGAGYEPASITAKAGSPVTLTVGKGEGCAAGFNMPQLGVHADNSSGPVKVKLGKVKAGSYTYTSSMGMVSGTLRVR